MWEKEMVWIIKREDDGRMDGYRKGECKEEEHSNLALVSHMLRLTSLSACLLLKESPCFVMQSAIMLCITDARAFVWCLSSCLLRMVRRVKWWPSCVQLEVEREGEIEVVENKGSKQMIKSKQTVSLPSVYSDMFLSICEFTEPFSGSASLLLRRANSGFSEKRLVSTLCCWRAVATNPWRYFTQKGSSSERIIDLGLFWLSLEEEEEVEEDEDSGSSGLTRLERERKISEKKTNVKKKTNGMILSNSVVVNRLPSGVVLWISGLPLWKTSITLPWYEKSKMRGAKISLRRSRTTRVDGRPS